MNRSKNPAHCGISLAAPLLAGCGSSGGLRDLQRMEKARELQEASLLAPGPTDIDGMRGERFVMYRRVIALSAADIATTDATHITDINWSSYGCITPVTADGYFLTAAHVAEEVDLGADTQLVTQLKLDPRPGRVVKTFPKADLALIKFPTTTSRYFGKLASAAEPGETVFSDAAKGTVISSSRREGGLITIECELVSIPGQS
ncbi:MAG: hypothetical protein ACR2RV_28715, partial [Verrucomicrobiales bacterium]